MQWWDEQSGFLILPEFLSAHELTPIRCEVEQIQSGEAARAGMRSVVERSPLLAHFAVSEGIRSLITPVLGAEARLVRSILFDKTPTTNWDVAWHQDTTIAVIESPGFGPWSCKAGVPHVRPPRAILERMLTLRLNIDANGSDDGPLLVAPGTHGDGIAAEGGFPDSLDGQAVPCLTSAGGVVLMRPLLFHASRKAHNPTRRRVLHLEFAGVDLPPRLRWASH